MSPSPRAGVRVQDTLRGVVLLVVGLCACATPGPSSQSQRLRLMDEANALVAALEASSQPPPRAGSLRVRLAFGAGADLDLYVTGPARETVYFANSPARSGGTLERDLRCDGPAPRIEVVRFERAAPGRYRVGVDFPRRCGGGRDPVSFVVYLETDRGRRERRGSILPGHFLPIVLTGELRQGALEP
ncbi:MAG: hypothetical protein ACE5IL_16240 [Myxococcota bacterium]